MTSGGFAENFKLFLGSNLLLAGADVIFCNCAVYSINNCPNRSGRSVWHAENVLIVILLHLVFPLYVCE